jgi:hypothetical protein
VRLTQLFVRHSVKCIFSDLLSDSGTNLATAHCLAWASIGPARGPVGASAVHLLPPFFLPRARPPMSSHIFRQLRTVIFVSSYCIHLRLPARLFEAAVFSFLFSLREPAFGHCATLALYMLNTHPDLPDTFQLLFGKCSQLEQLLKFARVGRVYPLLLCLISRSLLCLLFIAHLSSCLPVRAI